MRSVTLQGTEYPVVPSGKGPAAFGFEVLEHCTDDVRDELFIDGVDGTALSNGADGHRPAPRTEVADPSTLAADETLVIAPEQRASGDRPPG